MESLLRWQLVKLLGTDKVWGLARKILKTFSEECINKTISQLATDESFLALDTSKKTGILMANLYKQQSAMKQIEISKAKDEKIEKVETKFDLPKWITLGKE